MKRTPTDQYGWAGGCLGVVLGVIVLPVVRIIDADDRDLVFSLSFPVWMFLGGVLGGIVGGLIGLLVRWLAKSKTTPLG